MIVFEWMDYVAHQSWFRAIDFVFHVFVFWHVVAHVCRAGKRLHRWVHRPLLRAVKHLAPYTYLRARRSVMDRRFARRNAFERMEHS